MAKYVVSVNQETDSRWTWEAFAEQGGSVCKHGFMSAAGARCSAHRYAEYRRSLGDEVRIVDHTFSEPEYDSGNRLAEAAEGVAAIRSQLAQIYDAIGSLDGLLDEFSEQIEVIRDKIVTGANNMGPLISKVLVDLKPKETEDGKES